MCGARLTSHNQTHNCLVKVVKSLDTETPDFAHLVYQGLQQRYPA